jgi:hypothetical protein
LIAGLRRRLTYANVMATIAVFIALGGGAYAAAKIDSGDVKDNSLKSVDLKDGKGVQGADVAPDSLGGAAIDETSLGKVPSATSADSATDADTLDGKDSGDFAAAGSDATVFMGSTGGTIGGGTAFVGPSGAGPIFGSEANAATPAPVAMVVTDLVFQATQPPGVGSSRTLTMRVNGLDTPISCTITGAAQSCSTSGSMAINPMDSIALRLSDGGTPPTAAIGQFGWRAETP